MSATVVSGAGVGDTGSTVVEESQTLVDEIEFTEGLTIDRGYISPYMVKDQERQVAELVNPKILVTDSKIDDVNDIVPLLEQLVKGSFQFLSTVKNFFLQFSQSSVPKKE